MEVGVEARTDCAIDFCLPYRELKELVRSSRSNELEVTGKFIAFPEMEPPPEDAIFAVLPANFGELIAQAAPIIDRNNFRRVLQGINLSSAGVTVTDGKQLLHLPTPQQQRYTFDNRRHLWNRTVNWFDPADRKILRPHHTGAGDDISVYDAVFKEIASKGDHSLFFSFINSPAK